jgi:hypothetical protein
MYFVRFQVLTAASIKITDFWDITPCIPSTLIMEAVRISKRLHCAISQKAVIFRLGTAYNIYTKYITDIRIETVSNETLRMENVY